MTDISQQIGNDDPLVPPVGSHAATVAADPFSYHAAHRRLAFLFRISAGMNLGLTMAIIMLTAVILDLFPLKEKELGLLRADPADDRIYSVEPIRSNTEAFHLIVEANLRRYVRKTLSVNPVTHGRDLDEAAQFTDADFFHVFQNRWLDSRDYKALLRSGIHRDIKILDIDRLEVIGPDHKYSVDYEYFDKRHGETIKRGKRRAYIHAQTRPQEVSTENKYMNPAGVFVLDMVLKDLDQ